MPQLFNTIYNLHTQTEYKKMKGFLKDAALTHDEMNAYINPVLQSKLSDAQRTKMLDPSVVITCELSQFVHESNATVNDIRARISASIEILPDAVAQEKFNTARNQLKIL